MIRLLGFMCLFSSMAIHAQNQDFEPQSLLKQWQICQFEQSSSPECEGLRPKMQILEDNVTLMQENPQKMGLAIMHLQNQLSQDISAQERDDVIKNLQAKLATVGWLESPK